MLKNLSVVVSTLFIIIQLPLSNQQARSQEKYEIAACNYNSTNYVPLPVKPQWKYNLKLLSTYDRGVDYDLCAKDFTTIYMRVDCVSRVGYVLGKNGKWIKEGVVTSGSVASAMCARYF